MTTRAAFRSNLREVLSDESTWPDSTLNAWINDAIRDFSNYFPRQLTAEISCTANTKVYSLAAYTGLLSLILVEYPKGETPPRYLLRRPESGAFYELPVYDLRGDPPSSLVLGESPATGEKIDIYYSATHPAISADTTALTISDQQLDALRLYCIWQAVREMELGEAQDPDRTTTILNALGLNGFRAERAYRTKIADYQAAAAPGGYAGPWVMDKHDRIY